MIEPCLCGAHVKPKHILTDVVGKGRCCKIGSIAGRGSEHGDAMGRL